ncbi:MAG: hypothetical protein WDN50_26080 [Bradyrhizobium sp.]
MTADDIDRATHRTISAVWRIEQPRLITSLSRMLRDVPLAEELTQTRWWRRSSTGPKPACRKSPARG